MVYAVIVKDGDNIYVSAVYQDKDRAEKEAHFINHDGDKKAFVDVTYFI